MKHTINLLLLIAFLTSCSKKKEDPQPQNVITSNKTVTSGCNNQTIYTDTVITVVNEYYKITENCDSIIIQFKNGIINSVKTPTLENYSTFSGKTGINGLYYIWGRRNTTTGKVWFRTYGGIVYSKIYR